VTDQAQSQRNRRRGVIGFLSEDADGNVRLKFDDVTTEDGTTWEKAFPYTSMTFDAQRFRSTKLSPEELASIGLVILARLSSAASGDGDPT
jgi:hypothetical protein